MNEEKDTIYFLNLDDIFIVKDPHREPLCKLESRVEGDKIIYTFTAEMPEFRMRPNSRMAYIINNIGADDEPTTLS